MGLGRGGERDVERDWGGLVADEDVYLLADFRREFEKWEGIHIGGCHGLRLLVVRGFNGVVLETW